MKMVKCLLGLCAIGMIAGAASALDLPGKPQAPAVKRILYASINDDNPAVNDIRIYGAASGPKFIVASIETGLGPILEKSWRMSVVRETGGAPPKSLLLGEGAGFGDKVAKYAPDGWGPPLERPIEPIVPS